MLMINIGVLAIQGSFIEHVNAFESLQENNQNVDLIVQQVRTSDDLKENIHGLVIPGGESTTIGHFFEVPTYTYLIFTMYHKWWEHALIEKKLANKINYKFIKYNL